VYNLATHCTWRVTSISIPSSVKLNNPCFTPILLLRFIFSSSSSFYFQC
jgi:hypothetical protein